ncbi:leucyl aminopeptidase family protein [Staphylococcus simiae]|uniref:leucyl aminopeptidase family protein n=1 Tax=Staphylococcus simiae TaxID=308354 RepID=UPI00059482FD|nr:aminopeptidase [Staphylococcus simiae]
MNFKINATNTQANKIDTIIIGVPDHFNQTGSIIFENEDLTATLEIFKHQHIIGSTLGKIYSTALMIDGHYKRLVTIGLGNLKKLQYADMLNIWGTLFQYMKDEHIVNSYLMLDSLITKYSKNNDMLFSCALQSVRSIYQFDDYASNKRAPFNLDIYLQSNEAIDTTIIHNGQIIGQAINLVRDISQIPSNILTPQYVAHDIQQRFENSAVTVDVKSGNDIVAEGFGLIQAVGQGSSNHPSLITLTYNGANKSQPVIALVGKGLTYQVNNAFNSNNHSKQLISTNMNEAATIVAIVEAVNKLKLPINIVAIIACADNRQNMIKLNDIYTGISGESIEIVNNDDIGTLLLADAVQYANQFQPQLIIDIAILSQEIISTLGSNKAAVFQQRCEDILRHIREVAELHDEMIYELPLTKIERQLILQSNIADLINDTNQYQQGKTLFDASFICHFAGNTPYIHFDITGPAIDNVDTYNGPQGASGFLVTTLIQWLLTLK